MDKLTRRLAFLALACTAALPACSDSTGSRVGPAANLDVVSGNTQTAPAGTELPQPVVVKVTDAKGHGVKGQVVNFVVTAGGGHVFAGSSATDADGVAQERWTLGTTAGPQTLEVRAVDNATGQPLVFATFTATAVAGAATQAAVLGDTSVVGVPGSVVEDSFAVIVRDQYGNPVPGVQVAWAVTAGGGTITSPTTTDAAGVARTQWVLGTTTGDTPQRAQATAVGTTVGFTAYPVRFLFKLAGDGAVQAAGSVVTVKVGASNVEGLPIHWTVTSGGGSVTPAVVRTSGGGSEATAQWTLGLPGPQTLTASAGSLSATFTATSVVAGQRTQLANVAGRILDLDATRVLYVDSTTGPARQVRLRTLSGGAEVVVDSGFNGRLTPAGALVVRGAGPTLVEVNAGVTTSLGPIGFEYFTSNPLLAVSGNWAAWETATVGTVIRRDLAAGTNLTVATPPSGAPTRASLDVGSNGDVAYEYYSGGSSGGTSVIKLFHGGAITDVYSGSAVGLNRPKTDGGNVLYTRLDPATGGNEQWLWHAGTTERLARTISGMTLFPVGYVAGGWVTYMGIYQIATAGQYTQVRLRTPGGLDEAVSPASVATRPEALCPDGSVVYAVGTYSAGQSPTYTRRYIAYRGGPLVDAGAYDQAAVVCRGGRFFLFTGGTGYELSQ